MDSPSTVIISKITDMDDIASLPSDFILDADTIRRELESLPQEIYDQIYKEVFTAPAGKYCVIRKNQTQEDRAHLIGIAGEDYVPNDLKLLHISRPSRELYAKTYYGKGSEFLFSIPRFASYNYHWTNTRYQSWLMMLPRAHYELVPKIIMVPKTVATKAWNPVQNIWTVRKHLLQDGHGLENTANVFLWTDGKVYGRELDLVMGLLREGGEKGWESVAVNRRAELDAVVQVALEEYGPMGEFVPR